MRRDGPRAVRHGRIAACNRTIAERRAAPTWIDVMHAFVASVLLALDKMLRLTICPETPLRWT
jgi:hypothetical protein